MKIHIASKLTSPEIQKLNEQIYNMCINLNFKVYLPQIELPLGSELTALQILEENEKAVSEADLEIVVFDQAGVGTAMELERAYMLNKPIVGYRSEGNRNEDIGKMMEGAWERIPNDLKVNSLAELNIILQKLKA